VIKVIPERTSVLGVALGILVPLGFVIALVIVVSLGLLWLGGRDSPVCGAPPALHGDLPQWVMVVVCSASFLVGGISAVLSRRQWPALDDAQDYRIDAAIKVTLVLVMFVIVCLFSIEAVTLYLGQWPITLYVRCSTVASSSLALLAAGSFCFVTGRWFWDLRRLT
jgi:hypothetical protein